MWRIFMAVLLLAGCAQMQPSPQNVQAVRFDVPPGNAVIYIVRTPLDSPVESPLALDDRAQITTWTGTYYRWEVPAGVHRVAGLGRANESVTLTTAAGNVYFLEHTVTGSFRHGVQLTSLRQIDDRRGRELVQRSQAM